MYTPEQRIERLKVSMFRDPRFAYMAGVFMIGQTYVDHSVPAARTDGRNVWFNPEFIAPLNDAELRGLIYHEYGGHIMYQHLTTFKFLYDDNPQLANMACDYVVNQIIKDFNDHNFITLPQGGLQDDRFRGMDSKQVFNILKSEEDAGEGQGAGGEGLDEHDWESAASQPKEQQEQLAKEIANAVRQGATASKLLGHPVDRRVEEWFTPRVDWREALRQYLTAQIAGDEFSSYRKPRRRMLANDVYMPTSFSNTTKSLVVAVDTSYSIDDVTIAAFLSEVADICEVASPQAVHLLYWGTSVASHEIYTRDAQPNLRYATSPKAGGGTDVECVVQYMNDMALEADCVVVLTDGYLAGSWGQWPCPVLWAITSSITAEVGTTIRLTL